ncbi:MAG: GatB/YqeY domain-containing protein [Anaerolineaceae bacterium]|nr:GatB/YqeY domain-containing protein [Anaerolineaceae bacterium]
MDTKQKLEQALREAMRSGDQMAKNVIRLVLTNLKLIEVDHGKQDESGVIALIQKEIKMRQEAIREAEKGERTDVIADNQTEIKYLKTFLPEQMSEEAVREIVQEVVAQVGATNMKDMGAVMKGVSERVQGKAPNRLISQIARELLS